MTDSTDSPAGAPEPVPASFAGLERLARERLGADRFDYVAAGAGAEDTVRANREAFRRRRIVPRVLRDSRRPDLSADLFGERLASPLLLAPVANQAMFHDEGELATARAARSVGVPFVVSTDASRTFEAVGDALGDTPRWLQVHGTTDRDLLARFVERAEAAGYGAVVLAVDTPTMGWRERLVGRDVDPRADVGADAIANYLEDPGFRSGLDVSVQEDPAAAMARFRALGRGAAPATWETLEEIAGLTDLPFLLKGVLHPDDARLAAERDDVDGIVVSNHGGRQVDGAVAALDALDRVTRALDGSMPVLFDSGVRRGSDVFMALALGASAVLLGRPYLYGLAVGGEAGVEGVLRNLLASLERTMYLAGCHSVGAVDRGALVGPD